MNHDIKFLDSLVGGQLIVRGYCRHCSLSIKHTLPSEEMFSMSLNPFQVARQQVTLGMKAMPCSGPGTHQDNIVRVGDRWCYDFPCHDPAGSGVLTRKVVVKNVRCDGYADVQAEEEGSLLIIRGLQLDKAGCPSNLRTREGQLYKWYRATA